MTRVDNVAVTKPPIILHGHRRWPHQCVAWIVVVRDFSSPRCKLLSSRVKTVSSTHPPFSPYPHINIEIKKNAYKKLIALPCTKALLLINHYIYITSRPPPPRTLGKVPDFSTFSLFRPHAGQGRVPRLADVLPCRDIQVCFGVRGHGC